MKKILLLTFVLLNLITKADVKYCVNSGDWDDPNIWSPVGMPQLGDTAKIDVGFSVVIPVTVTAKPHSIVVNGDLINKNIIYIAGNLRVEGTFTSDINSKNIFNGLDFQNIEGSGPINFWDVDNLNQVGLEVFNNVDLYNNLFLDQNSVFEINDGYVFTLKSTSTNTARILFIPSTAVTNGKITQERWTNQMGYHMIGFSTDGFYCTTYDETVPGGLNLGYYNNNLVLGQGGFVQNTTPGQVYSSSGPISRDVVIPLTCSGTDAINGGWNLISNPLPCEVDIDHISFGTFNITNTFYVWDPVTNRYLWWRKGSGGTWNNKIASGQGFWVKALDNSAFVKVVEDTKVSSANYYRTTQNNFSFKIKIKSNNDTVFSLVNLDDLSSENYEPTKDALFLEGQNTNVTEIFTKTADDFNLVYDSRPLLDSIVIPIWIKVPTANVTNGALVGPTHKIMIDGLENLPSDYEWCLKTWNNLTLTSWDFSFFGGYNFLPTTAGKTYYGTLCIYKKPVILSVDKKSNLTDLGEVVAVYDLQGRSVQPDVPGCYIFVYKTKTNQYIRKRKYIY